MTTWINNRIHDRTFTGKSYGIMGCTTHEGTADGQPPNVVGHPATGVRLGAFFKKMGRKQVSTGSLS
jgi:hypothetical protein